MRLMIGSMAALLALGGAHAAQAAPASGAHRGRAARAAHASRRPAQARRCRDIFCTSQVIRVDGSAKEHGLSYKDVERVMRGVRPRLEPCLVQARRRDPRMRGGQVELVVAPNGVVLASRVDGKRRSPLARCVHTQLRRARFPRDRKRPRQVASFRLTLAQ